MAWRSTVAVCCSLGITSCTHHPHFCLCSGLPSSGSPPRPAPAGCSSCSLVGLVSGLTHLGLVALPSIHRPSFFLFFFYFAFFLFPFFSFLFIFFFFFLMIFKFFLKYRTIHDPFRYRPCTVDGESF